MVVDAIDGGVVVVRGRGMVKRRRVLTSRALGQAGYCFAAHFDDNL